LSDLLLNSGGTLTLNSGGNLLLNNGADPVRARLRVLRIPFCWLLQFGLLFYV